MTDVFDALAAHHSEVKRMLAELEAGPTGGTEEELLLRKKMTEQLVIEESRHEALEEMYFWPAVREQVDGGDVLADSAIKQGQEGKQVLDELGKADASDPAFEHLVAAFIRAGREHMRFEEETIWPRAYVALPAELADLLGRKITEDR